MSPDSSRCLTDVVHGWKESNLQPLVLETSALPVELHPHEVVLETDRGAALSWVAGRSALCADLTGSVSPGRPLENLRELKISS